MATEIISHDQDEKAFDANLGAIEDALGKARAELSAITDAASAADTMADDSDAEYSLHEVQGIGRYAVVRRTGWRPLLKVIHDLSANIDFSANAYPTFDGVIGKNFQSPYLLDPLHERYESYRDLRDNIAAVRNFLMETYYVDTPAGMTPEKAKQAMTEIAAFIGKGLDNNYIFMGLLPNHRAGKPFIDLDLASASGGAGAQYIYERILEMHRQSSWMRPFAAVISLFGGHVPPDWMLPPAHETEFTDLFTKDIATNAPTKGPSPDLLKEGVATVDALEATRARAIDKHQISNIAYDLSALGDHLLHSAAHMQDVTQLSEPVRRDAIEIAKDILRKLRGSLGEINIKDGLNLPPKEDLATVGALKGVAMIYERMVGYARTVDASIMQHPSVISGVQAIGQLGYLAKMEALRMAKVAGNEKLANEIGEQLGKLPEAYRPEPGVKFSSLMDRIEAGMNTMLSRLQTISGPSAQIGNSATRDVGQSITQAPTAGIGQQVSNTGQQNDAAKRNAEMLASEMQQAQARFNARQQSTKTTTTTQTTQTQQSRSSSGRQVFQQSRQQQQQRQSSTTGSKSIMVNPAQRTHRSSSGDTARLARIQQEQLHHEEEVQQQQRMLEIQRKASQKADAKQAARKIDPNMLKGFQKAMSTTGMGPVITVKKSIEPAQKPPSFVSQTAPKAPGTPEDKNLPPNSTIPPYGRGGRGI